jgi:hypothetical protein
MTQSSLICATLPVRFTIASLYPLLYRSNAWRLAISPCGRHARRQASSARRSRRLPIQGNVVSASQDHTESVSEHADVMHQVVAPWFRAGQHRDAGGRRYGKDEPTRSRCSGRSGLRSDRSGHSPRVTFPCAGRWRLPAAAPGNAKRIVGPMIARRTGE